VLESVFESLKHHNYYRLRATAIDEPDVALTTLAGPLPRARLACGGTTERALRLW